METIKPYTVDGYEATYVGKPSPVELILAVKMAAEEGVNFLQAFSPRDDNAFVNLLRTCQFVEVPTTSELPRLFRRVFYTPKVSASELSPDFRAQTPASVGSVAAIAANDPRIRRIN